MTNEWLHASQFESDVNYIGIIHYSCIINNYFISAILVIYIVETEFILFDATLHTKTQHWFYEAVILQESNSFYSSISANIGTMEQLNIVGSCYLIVSHWNDGIQRLRDQFDLLIVHPAVYTMRQPLHYYTGVIHVRLGIVIVLHGLHVFS